jgi:FkbM family methyltransferase
MDDASTPWSRARHRVRSWASYLRHARVIHRRQLYRYWEEEHLRRLFAMYAIDCVFDVGADRGQYARMIRSRAGFRGTIVSFEPNPTSAQRLREAARGDPKWIVLEQALSSNDGPLRFNVMVEPQFSSISEPSHAETDLFVDANKVARVVTVQAETLSTAFARLERQIGFKRPFLKLDTQGSDVSIVQASPDAVGRFIGLQSELAVRKLYADSVDFRDAISVYERHGFVLSCFVPNNAGYFPQMVEVDCIMVRRDGLPSTAATRAAGATRSPR